MHGLVDAITRRPVMKPWGPGDGFEAFRSSECFADKVFQQSCQVPQRASCAGEPDVLVQDEGAEEAYAGDAPPAEPPEIAYCVGNWPLSIVTWDTPPRKS